MTPTRVTVLTPPGVGAIATVEVAGPQAWMIARQLFQPAGKPLPEEPEPDRFWFGKLGGDEVILAALGGSIVEIHCHGGRRVVRWVVEQFLATGCVEDLASGGREPPVESLLQRAPTLRTASILLDQFHGAFDRAVERILESPTLEGLSELARYAPIGRHLVEPCKVVVAGPPNVGKSSLVNALAGYQRAIVSNTPGTTRDVVSVRLAFDGWPIELIDTAGLREAEGLEAEGIERARRALLGADLVLWVSDATDLEGSWPKPGECPMFDAIFVINKIDLPNSRDPNEWNRTVGSVTVSATVGTGIADLVAAIVRRLVHEPPPPGAAVPYTAELTKLILAAETARTAGRIDEAARLLRDCLGRPG